MTSATMPRTRRERGPGGISPLIFLYWLSLLGLLLLLIMASLRLGTLAVSTGQMMDAIFSYDPDVYEQIVIRTLRIPRTLVAAMAGAALAVAGSAMQAVTRNPLAGPSIFGVNAGAAFAVVIAIYLWGITRPIHYVWFAFAGGLSVSALVFIIASSGRAGASPAKLALAGVIVSSLIGAWTTAILILDQQTLEIVRFWMAGSLSGRDMEVFFSLFPFVFLASTGLLLLGHQLNVLALGNETAMVLGMNTSRVKGITAILVVLLSGSAVSAAGPIAFVGLAVPHIIRSFTGPDYRRILFFSILAGPAVLIGADILGRIAARPGEIPVGIVTALIGAPFLIVLARRRKLAGL